MTDYLACTKSPPAEVPRQLGLGVCMEPRNHDGPCAYEWMGGKARMEIRRGPSPASMVDEIQDMRRRARVHLRIAMACAVLNLGILIYNLGRLFG